MTRQNAQPNAPLPNPLPRGLTIGDCAALACLLEVSAPKAGNVHRSADFADMTLNDFLVSGIAIRRVFDRVDDFGVGRTIREAVEATRQVVEVNTNLGLMMLLAPLAKAAASPSITGRIDSVLQTLTPKDAHEVYAAIRLAQPGGMGEVEEMDVAETPPDDLLEAMSAAADRDLIARHYTNDFADVFTLVANPLVDRVHEGLSLTEAIVDTHLRLMASHPDSLIARKRGAEIANQSAAMAARVIAAGKPFSEDYLLALKDLDFWLRADGNARNPGTSADMIGAGLFVVLWEGKVEPPWR